MYKNDVIISRAVYYLQNKKEFTNELIQSINSWIEEIQPLYPIAAFVSIFSNINTKLYVNNYLNNYNYLLPIFNNIYQTKYTKQEIAIVVNYLSFYLHGFTSFQDDIKKTLQIPQYFGDKIDIIYYLNEFKYTYVRALIYNDEDNEDLIFSLLDELKDYTFNNKFISTNEIMQ